MSESNLTDRQLLIWLEQQLAPEIPANNMVAIFRIAVEVDAGRLAQAFASVVARSDALRTVFEAVPGGARQRIADVEGGLEVVDLSGAPDPEAAFRVWFDERRQRRFRLERRAFDSVLVRLGEQTVWYLCLHHLITDATSFSLIYQATMRGYLAGAAEPLPPFADVLAAEERSEASAAFWRQRLAEPLEPVRFYGRADPRTTPYSRRRTLALGQARLAGLRRASQGRARPLPGDQGLAAAFIALAMAYVHRVSGNRRIGVGTPVANRRSKSFRETIGLFMEVPQVRAELAEGETFASLLDQVRRDLFQVLPHSGACVSNPSRSRAYEVMVNFQTVKYPSLLGPTRTELFTGTTGFEAARAGPSTAEPLVITIHDFDDGAEPAASFDFNLAVFDEAACDRAVAHFVRLLDACILDPMQRVDGVDLLSDDERRHIVSDFAGAEVPRPPLSVVEKFEAQARRTPEAIAVCCGERTLDYAGLARRVEAIGGWLRRLGVGVEDRVAVRMDRSIDMVAALLGIWKAGGAYVPLDPTHPPHRTAQILEDAEPRLLLTTRALRPSLATPGLAVACLEDLQASGEAPVVAADRLAYVLFTSGSTGRPKGVEVTHPALVSFLLAMAAEPGLTAADRVLALTTTSFDIAALELFLPLIVGGTVDLVGAETSMDGRRLRAHLEGAPVTLMQATPATWRMLIDAGWPGKPGLRILSGGEALPPDLAAQLLSRGSAVWNMYGPTETTVWSTIHRVSPAGAVPIGRPIANTTVYVLGPDRAPVPVGVPGELYIGGAGVARGYRGRPELTAERFLDDPFSRAGARMYRTGDLASFSDDGVLHYHGRVDRQIKLRGFRIEPGEIEEVLRAVPGVTGALVVAFEESGQQELCAYWTGDASQQTLFERARATLPGYMVPSAYVPLAEFPLTASGKIDHHALPSPRLSRAAAVEGMRPRDGVEERIASIWSEVLGVSPIPVDQDFFALGGTSMKVLETRARVERALGVELPVAAFFEPPATVAVLASRIARPGRHGSLVVLQERGEQAPLFLVHDADGATLPYANLAHRLAGERPVYGLQPQPGEHLPMAHTRIEEMAAHYISAIRAVQPNGPYLLGGLCAGAVIAGEMARQLEATEEEARLVAVFDAADAAAVPKPHLDTRRRLDRLEQALRESRLRNLPAVLAAKLRGYVGFELRTRLPLVLGRLALAVSRARGEGHPLPRWARKVPVRTICTLALAEYRRPYAVREEIILFRATSGEGDDEPFAQLYDDPTLGWRARTVKGVRSIDVPGGHSSMLQEPHVAVVADRLRACLGSSASTQHNATGL